MDGAIGEEPASVAVSVRPTLTMSPAMRSRGRIHAWLVLIATPVACVAAALTLLRYGFDLRDAMLVLTFQLLGAAGPVVSLHRYFSHRSFVAGPRTHIGLAILGMTAAQGPLVYWVSNHRRHHRFSDKAQDPHSPVYGPGGRLRRLWHGHMGWMFSHDYPNPHVFARDLLSDRKIMLVNRLYPLWVLLGLAVPAAAGFALDSSLGGMIRGLVWGGLVRLAIIYHTTFAVNSLAHSFGTRRFETADDSRNTWWLSIVTLGDSWHNNHHAAPSSATTSVRWWEIDPAYLIILALKAFGLAREIRVSNRMAGRHRRNL